MEPRGLCCLGRLRLGRVARDAVGIGVPQLVAFDVAFCAHDYSPQKIVHFACKTLQTELTLGYCRCYYSSRGRHHGGFRGEPN